jgi:hypothetical protein
VLVFWFWLGRALSYAEGMHGFLPFLLFVVTAGLMAAWAMRTYKRTLEEFRRWAAVQGLTVAEGAWWASVPEATGMRAGRRLRVATFTTGSGKSKQTWLAAAVAVGAGGRLELEFKRQDFGTKVAEWFGAKEITVGEAGFDARWFVRTNQPDFVQAALLPEMRVRMDEVAALGGRELKIEIKDGWARYVERGGVSAQACERIERALPLLDELAVLAEVSAGERG